MSEMGPEAIHAPERQPSLTEATGQPGEAGAARREAVRAFTYGRDEPAARSLSIAVETPVELAYCGIPFAVMMLTPRDLQDFAYGFSLTEGLIRTARDIRGVSIASGESGIRVDIDLAPSPLKSHLARRRALSGRTGCGVCGIADLASLDRDGDVHVVVPDIGIDMIQRAVAELEAGQALNAITRSVHAAGWADQDGRLSVLREDVGRHNALDKLIGRLIRDDVATERGFLVITSRCSFEMVDKAAAVGAGMLVAMSAPTSLALDKARRVGMALIGIARPDGVTVFTGQSTRSPRDPASKHA